MLGWQAAMAPWEISCFPVKSGTFLLSARSGGSMLRQRQLGSSSQRCEDSDSQNASFLLQMRKLRPERGSDFPEVTGRTGLTNPLCCPTLSPWRPVLGSFLSDQQDKSAHGQLTEGTAQRGARLSALGPLGAGGLCSSLSPPSWARDPAFTRPGSQRPRPHLLRENHLRDRSCRSLRLRSSIFLPEHRTSPLWSH